MDDSDPIVSFLQGRVLCEKNPVTYRFLSRELQVPVSESKLKMLEFWKHCKSQNIPCHALLTSPKKTGDLKFSIRLISETQIDEADLPSAQIYCLAPSPMNDSLQLEHMSEEFHSQFDLKTIVSGYPILTQSAAAKLAEENKVKAECIEDLTPSLMVEPLNINSSQPMDHDEKAQDDLSQSPDIVPIDTKRNDVKENVDDAAHHTTTTTTTTSTLSTEIATAEAADIAMEDGNIEDNSQKSLQEMDVDSDDSAHSIERKKKLRNSTSNATKKLTIATSDSESEPETKSESSQSAKSVQQPSKGSKSVTSKSKKQSKTKKQPEPDTHKIDSMSFFSKPINTETSNVPTRRKKVKKTVTTMGADGYMAFEEVEVFVDEEVSEEAPNNTSVAPSAPDVEPSKAKLDSETDQTKRKQKAKKFVQRTLSSFLGTKS